MTKIVTKVKKKASGAGKISVENVPSWKAVLADVRNQIARLHGLVPIIERKVERGDPWPTQSTGQGSNTVFKTLLSDRYWLTQRQP